MEGRERRVIGSLRWEHTALLEWQRVFEHVVAFPRLAATLGDGTWLAAFQAHLERVTGGQARLLRAEPESDGWSVGRFAEVRYGQRHYGTVALRSGYLDSIALPHLAEDLAQLCGLLLYAVEHFALVQHQLAHIAPPDHHVHLTPRERDVLMGLVGGETQEQTARRLGVAEATVHKHRASLYASLDVSRAQDAVLRAFALRLIDWLDLPVLSSPQVPARSRYWAP